MSYLRDRAIILKSEPFREHDAWVTLYGRELGKMVAVARGARRMDAKAMGFVEPLAEVDVMIAKGAAFDKLAVAHALRPRLKLREKMPFLVAAASVADLVARLTQPGVGEPLVYDVMQELLDIGEGEAPIISAERTRLLVAGASLKLMDLLGYRPQLEVCAQCGRVLEGNFFIVGSLGGSVCAACARTAARPDAAPISLEALRLLRFLRQRPLRDLLQVTALSVQFLSASLAVESLLQQTPLTGESRGREVMAYLT